MITTLAGSNAYLLQRELNTLIATFVAEHTDMGLEKFDGEELDPKRLPSVIQSLPFLASKRMVVLRAPSAQKPLAEQLEKMLGDVPESTDLVIVEPSLDKRTSYYKALHKKTDFKSFDALDERALANWLVGEAKAKGASLKSADANFLVQRVGVNQSLLANELSKLISYNPAVTRDTITEMTDPLPQSSVFDLLDAAFAGNTRKVLALYHEQRQQKVEPLAMMGMIAWQLHILAVVKAAGNRNPADIASAAKLSPYVVRKSAGVAGKLSGAQLKDLIRRAFELDVRLKSQPIDADDAMQEFLISVAAN
jgi:DNA polymerase-3 subunit delta